MKNFEMKRNKNRIRVEVKQPKRYYAREPKEIVKAIDVKRYIFNNLREGEEIQSFEGPENVNNFEPPFKQGESGSHIIGVWKCEVGPKKTPSFIPQQEKEFVEKKERKKNDKKSRK